MICEDFTIPTPSKTPSLSITLFTAMKPLLTSPIASRWSIHKMQVYASSPKTNNRNHFISSFILLTNFLTFSIPSLTVSSGDQYLNPSKYPLELPCISHQYLLSALLLLPPLHIWYLCPHFYPISHLLIQLIFFKGFFRFHLHILFLRAWLLWRFHRNFVSYLNY